MGNLSKRVLLNLAGSLAKDVLPKLATKSTSSVLQKFERKISRKGVIRAGKVFNLFNSNEDTDDIFKIVESLEKLGLIIDCATETVQDEIKNQKVDFLGL